MRRSDKLRKQFLCILVIYLLSLCFVCLRNTYSPNDTGKSLHNKTICKNISGGLYCDNKNIQLPELEMKHTADIHDAFRQTTEKYDKKMIRSEEMALITLKPETAAMLNIKNKSNIKYEMTIDRPYLLENPDLCSNVENLTVIVLVHSALQHFEHRTIIRETWTNNSYYQNLGKVKVVFLLGKEKDIKYQYLIDNEHKQHGDILQGDFIDAYKNMTHKNVMGLKWLSERCRNAKIVLKVDDDVVINMFYFLTQFAPFFLMKSRHMACVILSKFTVKRSGTWAVDRSLFQGQYYYYPDYCQGFMVAISNDVIPALYKSASITPFFWIDDVFAYGMVPANVPNMQYTGLSLGSDVAWFEHQAMSCYQNANRLEKCKCFVVLVRGKVTQKLTSFWQLMLQEQNDFK